MDQPENPIRRRTDGREGLYASQRRLGWLVSIAIALAVLCFVFIVWLRPVAVTGNSMDPALRDGEIVLIDRIAKYWKRPARGDMILFDSEGDAFIKRIVGLPGETVELVGGQVFIDSRPLDEQSYAVNLVGDMKPVTVPEGQVFVLGDNREKIYDSRLERVGCIRYEQIEGVMRFRIAPITRLTMFF